MTTPPNPSAPDGAANVWPATRRLNFGRSIALAVTACVVAVTGCWTHSDSPSLIEASDAPVLIPTDKRFADTWKFRAVYSKNNYEISSNSSLHFDAALDPESTILGDQVNDRVGFVAGLRGKIDDSWLESYTTLFAAVDDPEHQDVCRSLAAEPIAYRCAIDGRLGDEATTWVYYYRRVPRGDGASTEMIVFDHPAAPDFIVGEFLIADVQAAAQRYLDTE